MLAHATKTPGIVIHRAVEPNAADRWAIPVERCGARLGLDHSATHALAGAYGGLPLKWESIPEFKSPQDMSEIVAALRKHLPSSHEFLPWLRLIQTDGAVYHPRPIPGSRRRSAAISEAA